MRLPMDTLGFASTTVLISLSFAVPIAWMVERTDLPGEGVETEIGTLVIQAPRQYEENEAVGVTSGRRKIGPAAADMENRFAAIVLIDSTSWRPSDFRCEDQR